MDLQEQFDQLIEQWHKHRQKNDHRAGDNRYLDCPAYHELIKLEKPALPLLLAEMKKKEDIFFCFLLSIAVRKILPGCTILEEDLGRPERITDLTISWLEQQLTTPAP